MERDNRVTEMERWRDGEMERWRDGEMEIGSQIDWYANREGARQQIARLLDR